MGKRLKCTCGKHDIRKINRLYKRFQEELEDLKVNELKRFQKRFRSKMRIIGNKYMRLMQETKRK